MANQFIIQNGAQVTGSLFVSESITAKTINADVIEGNIQYTDISASNTIRAKRLRLPADIGGIFLNGEETYPNLYYNSNFQDIRITGEPGGTGSIYVKGFNSITLQNGSIIAPSFSGSLDYSYIDNAPGFVDSTGTITQNNIAVFAESAQGLPINLPFSLPLYNDGNPTIRAFEGLSYTSSNLTVDNSITLTPTQSAPPTFDGVDGQIVVGMKGAGYAIYVWLGGGWRSGSLT
jgi:hypothetical protein